jgi:hypothetical protein
VSMSAGLRWLLGWKEGGGASGARPGAVTACSRPEEQAQCGRPDEQARQAQYLAAAVGGCKFCCSLSLTVARHRVITMNDIKRIRHCGPVVPGECMVAWPGGSKGVAQHPRLRRGTAGQLPAQLHRVVGRQAGEGAPQGVPREEQAPGAAPWGRGAGGQDLTQHIHHL